MDEASFHVSGTAPHAKGAFSWLIYNHNPARASSSRRNDQPRAVISVSARRTCRTVILPSADADGTNLILPYLSALVKMVSVSLTLIRYKVLGAGIVDFAPLDRPFALVEVAAPGAGANVAKSLSFRHFCTFKGLQLHLPAGLLQPGQTGRYPERPTHPYQYGNHLLPHLQGCFIVPHVTRRVFDSRGRVDKKQSLLEPLSGGRSRTRRTASASKVWRQQFSRNMSPRSRCSTLKFLHRSHQLISERRQNGKRLI